MELMGEEKNLEVCDGDIFIYQAPNNNYSAIRVITSETIDNESHTLIYTTAYFDKEIPTIEDEWLYHPWKKSYDLITWYTGQVPDELFKLGNAPLRRWEEQRIDKINGFGTEWGNYKIPYFDWLEKHKPMLYDQLFYGTNDEARQSTSIKSMHTTNFWNIIELIDLSDEENGTEAAIEKLASYSEDEIKAFEEALSKRLYKLDTKAHAEQIGDHAYQNDETYFSPDYFLYARCYVVAKGKEFYNKVVKQPKNMPKNKEFEPLLELASTAYERKTGDEMEFIPSVDYETFSNEEGWDERSN